MTFPVFSFLHRAQTGSGVPWGFSRAGLHQLSEAMNTTEPITSAEAQEQGLMPLTQPYRLPGQQQMLDGVLYDMRQGNIRYALVASPFGTEVWRAGIARSWTSDNQYRLT